MLRIENATVVFNKGTINEKKVFDKLFFDVEKGDFITIVGSNGAGKTTLFNLISGNIFCEEGSIYLNNKNITMTSDHKRARKIGRLFQNPLLGSAPNMSIGENLLLASGKGGWLSIASKKRINSFKEKLEMLDMGLENRLNEAVGLLSGGQRQALTLVMATFNPPDLLLLDEHTAALDPRTSEKVIDITKKIVEENNITCLMITHNMHQALSLGNRTIMMSDGKILLDIKDEEKNNYTIEKLLANFKDLCGKDLDNDRILLQND